MVRLPRRRIDSASFWRLPISTRHGWINALGCRSLVDQPGSPLYPVRGSASEGTTSCTCRTLPEQNSSIRCWTAANACSAELFRYLACTVSLSRLTHHASNSSVTIETFAVDQLRIINFYQMLRHHGRSMGSGTTESVRATRGSTDTGWNRRNTWMLCSVVSFLMARHRTAIQGRAVIISLCRVCAQSVRCHVP